MTPRTGTKGASPKAAAGEAGKLAVRTGTKRAAPFATAAAVLERFVASIREAIEGPSNLHGLVATSA